MDNGIDKKALFKMKTEPYLKPISDLGVGFYNLDENTAILQFQLTNNSGPLMISDNNVKSYAYFESKNGSASDVIDLEIIDNYNGIVQITIPKDFLQASTDTKVTGQVYIGVNNVSSKPEYNEVAVFREFNFEVKDALINKISSFTKIEYIRMFSQLKLKIEQQVVDIQEAIANGADYVAEMKSEREQGVKEINRTVTDGKAYIDNVVDQYKNEVATTKDDAIGEITTVSSNAKTSVNETADSVIKNINNISDDATEHIDGKVDEFNGLLETEGFVTSEELGNQLDELEWQKHKFTEDDGQPIFYTSVDPLTLPPGQYQISYMKNNPFKNNGSALYNVNVLKGTDKTKQVIAVLSYTGEVYIKNVHKGVDLGWKQISNTQKDTGWISFSLINGSESNTAYKEVEENGFDCAYRVINNKKILRLNGSNVTHGQVIAQLPFEFCKQTQTFPITIASDFNGAFIVIKPSGEVEFYIQGEKTSWGAENTIYGEVSWVE
ncbi:BppU family phage baseplate upper protein [Mammaliicoccus sp. H-M33]|uniref:BppU family phage baseplate upper protein n=1 Tax=Mammaliicoccus sp. H-M33 TaxID=2898692 RepID=UPI001EFAF9D7